MDKKGWMYLCLHSPATPRHILIVNLIGLMSNISLVIEPNIMWKIEKSYFTEIMTIYTLNNIGSLKRNLSVLIPCNPRRTLKSVFLGLVIVLQGSF